MCHVSCVTSPRNIHFFNYFFDKLVELVGGGSVIVLGINVVIIFPGSMVIFAVVPFVKFPP